MDYSSPIFDRLQDCWDPVSKDQLAQLQAELGVKFPADFRRFLLRFNAGSWPHIVTCDVQDPGKYVDSIGITANFGIIPDERFHVQDIFHKAEFFFGRIPETFVPIMSAWGDLVCIDIGEENYGKVYFWDKHHEDSDFNLVYLVADSFDEFLLSLKPDWETENYNEVLPIFKAVELGDKRALLEYLEYHGKVDARNEKGRTLLMCAVRNSWPMLAEILIQAGAEVNARDPDGWTPLCHAVFGGSLDSIKSLVAAEADTGHCDSQGRNLAQIAQDLHHYRVQYYLEPYMVPPRIEESPGGAGG